MAKDMQTEHELIRINKINSQLSVIFHLPHYSYRRASYRRSVNFIFFSLCYDSARELNSNLPITGKAL